MALPKREKFSQEEMERMQTHLRTYHELGEPIDYEVFVDGFKVVRRTSDPDRFNMYESFVKPNTVKVEVWLYQGTSNSNDKNEYYLKDDGSMNGIEVENRIQDSIQRAKRDWEYDECKKENERLQKEIGELEEEVEELETELEEVKSSRSPLNGILGELGSSFVESMIRRNPKLLAAIPGGKALSGMLEQEESGDEKHEPDMEVTYKAKAETKPDEETAKAVAFVGYLRERFKGQRYSTLMDLLDRLSSEEGLLEQVMDLIKK